MSFKPMLSPLNSPADTPTFFQDIQFPVFASVKLDGIRAVTRTVPVTEFTGLDEGAILSFENVVLSRTLKRIPSEQVQSELSKYPFLDGELIIGNPNDDNVYNRTQSHVMSVNKPGELFYFVFDYTDEACADEYYYLRLERLEKIVKEINKPNIILLPQTVCENLDELLKFETNALQLGYEGVMFRNPGGRYKHNRATYLENIIYKLKRFFDDEAIILDIPEGTLNTNEQEYDERGYSKRSDKQAGKIASGLIKNFIADWRGTILEIAPGVLTHRERKYMFENKEKFIGKYVKFRAFSYGVKDLPRFPRCIGLRNEIDMG
jgi:DNA ligase-1